MNRVEVTRFIKFTFVGILGALIDFGVLNLLAQELGVYKPIAKVVSFSCALANNFFWNRKWIYSETSHDPVAIPFVRFLIVSLLGLAINSSVFWSFDSWVFGERGLLSSWTGQVAEVLGWTHFAMALNGANAVASGVVLFWNFFANRLWTFGHVR